MKAPLSWLKKYISLSKDAIELAEILTRSGLEVEKIDRMNFSFQGVIIGKVLEVTPHPDASNLKIAIISDGKSSHRVVCGDHTLEKNAVVPFAKVGAVLIDEEGVSVEIKKAKLRGIESLGMLASEKELGISKDDSKVMRLPQEAPIGEDIANYLLDPTFDITITPNLGYCRSIIGIARELSSQLGEPSHPPIFKLAEDTDNLTKSKLQVTNEAHKECPQYYCRIIRGVEVKPSPSWLQDLLVKSGYKPINNIVDVTNFVMHELGQPMHAFDYSKLPEAHLTIRLSNESEKITTLDEVERTLPEGILLICDGDTPAAIGGIMGGLNSAITDKTHTVVLEAAEFDPSYIRKASKILGLRSESSARFENKIDQANVRFALDRAAALLKELAGGSVFKGVVEQSPKPYTPKFITCRLSKINALLGTSFSLGEVETFLSRLSINSSSDGIDLFQVKVPSWRRDLQDEIDLVEEVGRLYGYENIERVPPKHVNSTIEHHPIFLLEKEIRKRLVGFGLQEFVTCNLISPTLCNIEVEHGLFSKEYIKVLHAKSVDQSVLRPSLLPGLLQSLKLNQNQNNHDILAFEIGRIHFKEGGKYDEKTALGILLSGKRAPIHWSKRPEEVDFYDLKGILENLCDSLLLPEVSIEKSSFETFHPKRQSTLNFSDATFGVFGEIHPGTLDLLDIKGRVFFAEIDLHLIQNHKMKRPPFATLPQFPSSERDLTLTMDEETDLEAFFTVLKKIRSSTLKKVSLLDIYRGDNIGKNKKNVTFRFTYRDDEKTLSVKTIEDEHANIVRALQKSV